MTFSQDDYNELTSALDTALSVFVRQGLNEEEAQLALDDFVGQHYFNVWRAMNKGD